MKAYEAQQLVYEKNELLNGIKEINKKIEQAAKSGNFKVLNISIHYDWGSKYQLKEYFESQGYQVGLSHVQTSPNDGDDYISIYWEDQELPTVDKEKYGEIKTRKSRRISPRTNQRTQKRSKTAKAKNKTTRKA